jgi:hypothetical protein
MARSVCNRERDRLRTRRGGCRRPRTWQRGDERHGGGGCRVSRTLSTCALQRAAAVLVESRSSGFRNTSEFWLAGPCGRLSDRSATGRSDAALILRYFGDCQCATARNAIGHNRRQRCRYDQPLGFVPRRGQNRQRAPGRTTLTSAING